MKLKNKVALITGASRGIGKATALLFAKEGAKIVVNYVKAKKEADDVVNQIKALGSEAIAVQCDVSQENQVKSMVEKTTQKFGRIDILVNNAGIVDEQELSELNFKHWERTLHTNLIGTFLTCKEVVSYMKKQKSGKIINIASIRGLDHAGRVGVLDYSASKAGVINLTKTLARELGPEITVNSISPGWTKTEMNMGLQKDFVKEETKNIPLKRFAKPEEIAKAVLFLASPDADYITGQNLIVDGGRSLN